MESDKKYTEEEFQKIERRINKYLSKYKPFKDENFYGYVALVGSDKYSDLIVKIVSVFKKPFSKESSEISEKYRKFIPQNLKSTFTFLDLDQPVQWNLGSTTTLESYERFLDYDKETLGREINENILPFNQTVKNGVKTRVFDKNIDDHELQWHRDERDRIVEVVKGSGWKFQMDDKLPVTLKEGDRFTIPSEIYHRVIRGNGDLVIKIKEL